MKIILNLISHAVGRNLWKLFLHTPSSSEHEPRKQIQTMRGTDRVNVNEIITHEIYWVQK